MTNFLMGAIYERAFASHSQSARVVAIVDGGLTGWLKVDENKPFELSPGNMQGWKLKTKTAKKTS